MRAATIAMGLAAGAGNFALLAAGCKRLLGGKKRGLCWLLAGALLPVVGLVLCALLAPRLLPWFGCAAGGCLTVLGVVQLIARARSKPRI